MRWDERGPERLKINQIHQNYILFVTFLLNEELFFGILSNRSRCIRLIIFRLFNSRAAPSGRKSNSSSRELKLHPSDHALITELREFERKIYLQ